MQLEETAATHGCHHRVEDDTRECAGLPRWGRVADPDLYEGRRLRGDANHRVLDFKIIGAPVRMAASAERHVEAREFKRRGGGRPGAWTDGDGGVGISPVRGRAGRDVPAREISLEKSCRPFVVGCDAKKPTGDSVKTFVRRSVRFVREFHRELRRGYTSMLFNLPTLYIVSPLSVTIEKGGRLKHIDRRRDLGSTNCLFAVDAGVVSPSCSFSPAAARIVYHGLRTQGFIPPHDCCFCLVLTGAGATKNAERLDFKSLQFRLLIETDVRRKTAHGLLIE